MTSSTPELPAAGWGAPQPAAPSAAETELSELADTFRAEAEAPPLLTGEVATRPAPGEEGEQPPPPPPTLDAEAVALQIGRASFLLIGVRLGPHWTLTAAEEKTFAAGFAPLIGWLLERVTGVWIYAAVATATLTGIVAPRLMEDKRLEEEKQRAAAEAATRPPVG